MASRHEEARTAGKVRTGLAATSTLQDEGLSPTTTQVTRQEQSSPVRATLHPDYTSKDFSDWMLDRDYFLKYDKEFGPFDLDGPFDNDGMNSQVTGCFCCPAQPF